MPTYAIGDLQGCQPSLLPLLERIQSESADARLVFVGDMVNRGPKSLETLRTIRQLGSRATALLGNHDLHLLAVAQLLVEERAMALVMGPTAFDAVDTSRPN